MKTVSREAVEIALARWSVTWDREPTQALVGAWLDQLVPMSDEEFMQAAKEVGQRALFFPLPALVNEAVREARAAPPKYVHPRHIEAGEPEAIGAAPEPTKEEATKILEKIDGWDPGFYRLMEPAIKALKMTDADRYPKSAHLWAGKTPEEKARIRARIDAARAMMGGRG